MVAVARGKALVAKLRRQPGVRDAEALAAWLGRFKKARKAGKSVAEAKAAANGSGDKNTKTKPKSDAPPQKKKGWFLDDEDDFEDEPQSKEDKQREKYEAKQIAALEKAERSRVHSVVMEAGGLKTRADLREEYRGIPNTFKRKDGLPGDEMADYFSRFYPEFGIEDERDLIDFLAA
jgi:hypothetical protein